MRCECEKYCKFEHVWFIETEYRYKNGIRTETGRVRKACSHLVCLVCGGNICVDDTFDGEWYYPIKKNRP